MPLTPAYPFFTQNQPFTVAYRKNSPYDPVGVHSHDAAELYFTLSDLPDVILNDKVVEVSSGTLIIIPPFCLHQLYHRKDATYERFVLNIQMKWLEDVFGENVDNINYLRQSSAPLIIPMDKSRQKEIISLFSTLVEYENAFNPQGFMHLFAFLSAMDEIINSLSPQKSSIFRTSNTQRKTNEIIEYIQDNIYNEISVSSIAEHFYLNPDYISRLFKKHAHISLGSYITLVKMNAAQNLLREGHTVSEVQEKLGYSSYAYFFKTFKNKVGISPSLYKQNSHNTLSK